MRVPGVRGTAIAVSVGVLAMASPAAAATTLGQTFTPPETSPACSNTETLLQASSQPLPAPQYAAPMNGVITSWSFQTTLFGASGGLKLKVATPAGASQFHFVGESSAVVSGLTTNRLITTLTRIPVTAGDVIGLRGDGAAGPPCDRSVASPISVEAVIPGDPAVGSTVTQTGTFGSFELDLSARLEPDADGDGYGDETQDQCPTDPSTHGPCPVAPGTTPGTTPPGAKPPSTTPPETTISKGPKKKSTSKTATFDFRSSEAGSSFECSLDGSRFRPCSSPHSVNVRKPGKHDFQVRARDAAGNLDQSPAAYSWKLKKKKHRHHAR